MDQVAATLGERLARPCRLFMPLGRSAAGLQAPACAGAPPVPPAERAQLLAVLANDRGEIVRFYQAGSAEPADAGVLGRGAWDGRHDPAAEIRDIGSIAKVAAAVLLAEAGDEAGRRYCRQAFGGRRDGDQSTGHGDCSQPGALLEAREVFARSKKPGAALAAAAGAGSDGGPYGAPRPQPVHL